MHLDSDSESDALLVRLRTEAASLLPSAGAVPIGTWNPFHVKG